MVRWCELSERAGGEWAGGWWVAGVTGWWDRWGKNCRFMIIISWSEYIYGVCNELVDAVAGRFNGFNTIGGTGKHLGHYSTGFHPGRARAELQPS